MKELKDILVALGLVFMIGSVAYLLWIIRTSIERERIG